MFAVLGTVPWSGLIRGAEALILHVVGRQGILGQDAPAQADLQTLGVLQNFDGLTARAGHPVVIAIEREVTILIRVARRVSRTPTRLGLAIAVDFWYKTRNSRFLRNRTFSLLVPLPDRYGNV